MNKEAPHSYPLADIIKYFRLGMTSTFDSLPHAEQVRKIADMVFGKKSYTQESTTKLMERIISEMEKDRASSVDFWTETSSIEVRED